VGSSSEFLSVRRVRLGFNEFRAMHSRFMSTRARLNHFFELVERIHYRQENRFARSIVQVFCDAKHPTHSLNLYAQVEHWIETVDSALQPYKIGSRIHISQPIVQMLETLPDLDIVEIIIPSHDLKARV
jgi:hypothetical protein